MIPSLDLTVASGESQGTRVSAECIPEKATNDTEWQGGHRSLGLIVPDGRHPGQHWDRFTWLGQYVLVLRVCASVSRPREADSKIEREWRSLLRLAAPF